MRNRLLSLAASTVLAAASTAFANQFANPGFEQPITFDGAPFVGFWEGFNGGAGSAAGNSAASPRSGAQHADLSIFATNNTFAGVFQDVVGLVPGDSVTFSGYHKTTTSPLDLTAEFRLEWRNSVSNTEIARTPNSIGSPGSDYSLFSLTAEVPVGADSARAVYAIQTFTPEPTNNGTVFLDDMSFVVPEPGAGLVALCSMGFAAARRRRD